MRPHMVQPPGGEQANQPPNGREQLPNDPAHPSAGQPHGQQPGHGQPHGQPRPSYGPPSYGPPSYGPPSYGPPPYGTGGYEPPPVKQGNGFAVAGIILAVFVPVLGSIFSICGLHKSKARAGAGRVLSIVGIGVSMFVGAAAGTSIAIVASSPAVDSGCIAAQSAGEQMTNTLNADKAAISRDQNNPSAKQADLQHLLTDVRSLQRQMTAAEAQATHQSVKTRISAMTSDLNMFSSSLQAVEDGDLTQVSQITIAAGNMKSDGQAIAATCTAVSHRGPNP